MYKEGLLTDDEIYSDLDEIVTGRRLGRENDEEFIYFCSVGLAFVDVSFAKYMYDKCIEQGKGTEFQFSS